MHCPIRFGRLRAAGLVALALLAIAPLLFSAEPTPAKFTVPVIVNGQTYQGDATVDADGSIRVTIVLVYRVQPGPGPGPEPKPKPPDPPTPDEKAAFVYVIHESRPPTPDLAFAKIDNDKGWRDVAEGLKVGWRVLDQNNQALKKMPAPLITANKVGLPAAVFVFASGASKGEPLKGKSPADLAELIKRYGGKP